MAVLRYILRISETVQDQTNITKLRYVVSLHVILYSAIQHLCCNYVNKTQFSTQFNS